MFYKAKPVKIEAFKIVSLAEIAVEGGDPALKPQYNAAIDNGTSVVITDGIYGNRTPQEGDYLIALNEADKYICPADVFAVKYRECHDEGMSFSEALEAVLREGKKATRAGWNGAGMFIFFVPGSTFKVNRAPLLGIYPEGTEINYHGHVDMRNAQGQIVPWLASQGDLQATDWQIID